MSLLQTIGGGLLAIGRSGFGRLLGKLAPAVKTGLSYLIPRGISYANQAMQNFSGDMKNYASSAITKGIGSMQDKVGQLGQEVMKKYLPGVQDFQSAMTGVGRLDSQNLAPSNIVVPNGGSTGASYQSGLRNTMDQYMGTGGSGNAGGGDTMMNN